MPRLGTTGMKVENSTRFPPSVSDFNGLRFLNLLQDQAAEGCSIRWVLGYGNEPSMNPSPVEGIIEGVKVYHTDERQGKPSYNFQL